MGEPLLPTINSKKPNKSIWPKVLGGLAIAGLFTYQFLGSNGSQEQVQGLCGIPDKIDPTSYVYDASKIKKIIHDEVFRKQVVENWSGAIQIPSVSRDVMVNPNTTDDLGELFRLEPAWKEFPKLHEYLEKTFPLVHKNLKVEKVNKFALLYTWQGTKPEKKPILLTAHQDVVPVPDTTLDQWKYPPFSGTVEGDKMYGRGASDCKNLLLSLFETIELLLKEGKFEPERTILLGFGYDEESQGTGAYHIGRFLFDRYGPDSLYALIDEGNSGYQEEFGTYFFPISTGEKGHLNSKIELYTPGGHSSVPPPHTAVGLMSKLIDRIESVEFQPQITNRNPYLGRLQCIAEHGDIDKSFKSDIIKAQFDAKANKNLVDHLHKDISTRFYIETSQAADIFNGGVKSNALPEYVSAVVNHRIAAEESVKSTSEKVLEDIKVIANKFDLGIIFNNKTVIEPTEHGYFKYTSVQPLEPAPVTPTDTTVWNTFTGSLRYLYEDILNPDLNATFIPTPELSIGNTDTKSYWDLTSNIYRYEPATAVGGKYIHSINEWASIESHLSIISFYYYYLQVIDQSLDV